MEQKLENILFINTGGGIGDALSVLPTINYINEQLQKNFTIFRQIWKFWFDKKLQEYKPKNLITVKNFPEHLVEIIAKISRM